MDKGVSSGPFSSGALAGYRKAAIPYLTNIAHGTAPFITTFLLIHLSAPVLANLGGSSLASQVMLLGREYYQTPFGETYLVKAPIVIHILASILKRVLSPPERPPRPLSSLLTVSAFGVLAFLPVHYFTHRISPALPGAPIFAVGPAELDYEFVKVGLRAFPWRSWFLYLGLIGGMSIHSTEGMRTIWNTRLRKTFGGMKKEVSRIIALGSAVSIISGLVFLSQEPLMTFASVAERYLAAFTQSAIYRL
ncbi:hypothetical protein PLICRDRAFT_53817 [Plicaturopsis crispa FD-325 SS-3]|nr:hypothetical protein PLICRDRAFT_53817 [Plicaturopsis crispa FD-325 SS-3]